MLPEASPGSSPFSAMGYVLDICRRQMNWAVAQTRVRDLSNSFRSNFAATTWHRRPISHNPVLNFALFPVE